MLASVRWRSGESVIERALTSCEFKQLQQVSASEIVE